MSNLEIPSVIANVPELNSVMDIRQDESMNLSGFHSRSSKEYLGVHNFKIIETFKKANSLDDKNLWNYIHNNISIDNYYIFIYFIMKFKDNSYLYLIEHQIFNKYGFESFEIGGMTETVFESTFYPIVVLNSLSQSLELSYTDFFIYHLHKEKKVPASILSKVLQHEYIDLIQIMLAQQTLLYTVELETGNIFEKSSTLILFQRIDLIGEGLKIDKDEKCIMPKYIFYYLYKNNSIPKNRIEFLVNELKKIITISECDIFTSLIKMKDQDLIE